MAEAAGSEPTSVKLEQMESKLAGEGVASGVVAPVVAPGVRSDASRTYQLEEDSKQVLGQFDHKFPLNAFLVSDNPEYASFAAMITQSIYNRIPLPIRPTSETMDNHYFPSVDMEFVVHFASVDSQAPIANAHVTFDANKVADQFSQPLTKSQQLQIIRSRADAIIFFFRNISDRTITIYSALGISNAVLIPFLYEFLAFWQSWGRTIGMVRDQRLETYLLQMGFEVTNDNDLILGDLKSVQGVLPELMAPVDTSLVAQKWNKVDLFPVMIPDNTPYPVEASKRGEAYIRFQRDENALQQYMEETRSLIPIDDVAPIRMILQRMFTYLTTHYPNMDANWKRMLELENQFEMMGVIAEPSGQSWYTGIITRNNDKEIKSSLNRMRMFASLSPQFAPTQLKLEEQLRTTNKFNAAERQKSITYAIDNITNAADFKVVPINDNIALDRVHKHIVALRPKLRAQMNTISKRIAVIQETAPEDDNKHNDNQVVQEVEDELIPNLSQVPQTASEKNKLPKDAVFFHNKRAAVVKQLEDVETAFRTMLDTYKGKRRMAPHDLTTIEYWKTESVNYVADVKRWEQQNFVNPEDENQDTSTQRTTRYVQNVIQESKNIITKKQTGDTLDLKSPSTLDPQSMERSLEVFRQNIAKLQEAEEAQKMSVRQTIEQLKMQGFGAKDDIDKLNDESVKKSIYTDAMRIQTSEAKTCFDQFLLLALHPHVKQLPPEEEKKVALSTLNDLLEQMKSRVACLTSYYKTLQLLQREEIEQHKKLQSSTTAKYVADLEKMVTQASIAIQESEMLKETSKNNMFQFDIGDTLIENMKTKRTALQKQVSDVKAATANGQAFTTSDIDVGKSTAHSTLREIVRIGLSFKNNIQETIQQASLVEALKRGETQVNLLQQSALTSAERANEELEKAKKAYEKHARLVEAANRHNNPARRTSISFDALETQWSKARDNFRLDVMGLITTAYSLLNNPSSTVTQFSNKLAEFDTFEAKNEADMKVLPAEDSTSFSIAKAKMKQRVIDIQQRHARLAKENQSLQQIASMTLISSLLDTLSKQVNTGNKQAINTTLRSLARQLKQNPVYTLQQDAKTLIKDAKRKLVESDSDSEQNSDSFEAESSSDSE